MAEEVKHYQVNGKYRIVFERSAVKGQDGFKVEANGDKLNQVELDAMALYSYVQEKVKPPAMLESGKEGK